MSKLLLCGVSGYLFFSGLTWGPACAGVIVLIAFWDYFSEVAGEMAENQAVERTRKRLRSDLHAPAHPYWVLRALESGRVSLKPKELASGQAVALSVFAFQPQAEENCLKGQSGLSLEEA